MAFTKEFLGKFDDPTVKLKPTVDDFEVWQATGLRPQDIQNEEDRAAYAKYLGA